MKTAPTTAQMSYAAKLARDLGVGSDVYDLIAHITGYSRSKAQKSATKESVSSCIDAAKKRLA